MNILIFGGTRDAITATNTLTDFIQKNALNIKCTYSLAGVTQNPNTPDTAGVHTEVHTGGFGGVQGIINYILQNHIQYVFDFTHPYATQITTNIHRALCELSLNKYPVTLYQYDRPRWHHHTHIQYKDSISDIVHTTNTIQGDIFVALGAKDAPLFFKHQGTIIVRTMQNIYIPNGTCIVAPPPQNMWDEQELFDTYDFQAVICKDSGTNNGYHKIAIAQERNIPIYMLSRPHMKNALIYDNTYISTDVIAIVHTFIHHLNKGGQI